MSTNATRLALAVVGVVAIAGLMAGDRPQPASGGSPPGLWTVNSIADDNDGVCGFAAEDCTLREAINASNGSAGGAISFNIGAGTPKIDILTPLPVIDKTVIINGATGGATRIELHGPGAAVPMNGLEISTLAPFSEIRNLVLNNFIDQAGFTGRGLLISASFVTLSGTFIGTNGEGTAAVPNSHGVLVFGTGVQIGLARPGDTCTGDCNLISGNTGTGLAFGNGAENGDVEGNFIGTDVTGSTAIPNGTGIGSGANNLSVGEAASGAGNVISGNAFAGIDATSAISIVGNRIGTNSTGTAAVPNVIGILISSAISSGAIGGTAPGDGNLISGNLNNAISLQANSMLVYGNLIGTAADGVTPLPNGPQLLAQGSPEFIGAISIGSAGNIIGGFQEGQPNTIAFNTTNGVVTRGAQSVYNQIRGNSIHSNAFKGIENDDGGNGEIPPPVILAAGPTGASGTSDVAVCGMSFCSIEIYSDMDDEGREYEGSTITDVNGDWTFTGPLSGPNITATATENHTSEFSAPFSIAPTPSLSPSPTSSASPTPTPTPTPTSTPTPTPTGAGQQVTWGDHNCSGSPDPIDGLLNLRHDAGLPAETNDCPAMGDEVDIQNASLHIWGDFDCSGTADPVDALKVLRFDAGLDVARPDDCPDPGETVTVS